MRKFIAALVIMLWCAVAVAENYAISVTRKSGNLYKVDGKSIFIHTRYCYVYAYSQQTILKSSGYGGTLVFVDDHENSEIKAVYGTSNQAPGKYSVTVSREDDDWYEVFGTGVFIRTSMCLSLALGQEAFLVLNAGGIGRLIFTDGQSCMVEGVHSKLRL
jgi:hypothetical protein